MMWNRVSILLSPECWLSPHCSSFSKTQEDSLICAHTFYAVSISRIIKPFLSDRNILLKTVMSYINVNIKEAMQNEFSTVSCFFSDGKKKKKKLAIWSV